MIFIIAMVITIIIPISIAVIAIFYTSIVALVRTFVHCACNRNRYESANLFLIQNVDLLLRRMNIDMDIPLQNLNIQVDKAFHRLISLSTVD